MGQNEPDAVESRFDGDADASEHFSQIPEGYAGELCEHDNDRADASAWLDPIPVIREFRRKVLGSKRKMGLSAKAFQG